MVVDMAAMVAVQPRSITSRVQTAKTPSTLVLAMVQVPMLVLVLGRTVDLPLSTISRARTAKTCCTPIKKRGGPDMDEIC